MHNFSSTVITIGIVYPDSLTAIGTLALAITTYISLGKLREQVDITRTQAKISQLVEEMEKLVAPCYIGVHSFAEDHTAFDMPDNYYRRDLSENNPIFVLMDSIITHIYLSTSSDFSSALDDYIKAKEAYFKEKGNSLHDTFEKSENGKNLRNDFEAKKKSLFGKIDSRFKELDNEIKREKNKFG